MKALKLLAVTAAISALAACSTVPSLSGKTGAASEPAVALPAGKAVVTTSENVDVKVVAYIVRNDNGTERLDPITDKTSVKSGDVVEYHGLLTNTGAERVRNMTATLLLPSGATFTGQTDPALGALASLDGKQFLRMPIRQSVNGQAQNVPFDKYRALQWTVQEVGIGATAVVKYRATIR